MREIEFQLLSHQRPFCLAFAFDVGMHPFSFFHFGDVINGSTHQLSSSFLGMMAVDLASYIVYLVVT